MRYGGRSNFVFPFYTDTSGAAFELYLRDKRGLVGDGRSNDLIWELVRTNSSRLDGECCGSPSPKRQPRHVLVSAYLTLTGRSLESPGSHLGMFHFKVRPRPFARAGLDDPPNFRWGDSRRWPRRQPELLQQTGNSARNQSPRANRTFHAHALGNFHP
jgi:hypothetical protein